MQNKITDTRKNKTLLVGPALATIAAGMVQSGDLVLPVRIALEKAEQDDSSVPILVPVPDYTVTVKQKKHVKKPGKTYKTKVPQHEVLESAFTFAAICFQLGQQATMTVTDKAGDEVMVLQANSKPVKPSDQPEEFKGLDIIEVLEKYDTAKAIEEKRLLKEREDQRQGNG